MSNTDTTKKVNLTYINPDAPRVAAPEYPGEYYDAQVPATLDLAERARLCVNALTECTDPIPERTDRVIVEKGPDTLIRRGNEVVWIDPPGKNCPLYQRGHYRQGETLWTNVRRFVPVQEIPWC